MPKVVGRRRAVIALAVGASVAAVVLAAPWDGDGGAGLVVERALAAVDGEGPVVHAVVTMKDAKRIELATGRVTHARSRFEMWHDEERGRARVVASRDGRLLGDEVVVATGPEWKSFAPSPAGMADFYRQALADGRARIIEEGRWRGRRVYWLELQPPEHGAPGAHVAIDRDTFRPYLMRVLDRAGRPTGFEFEFLVLETIPRRESDFPTAPKRQPLLTAGGFTSSSSDDGIGVSEVARVLEGPALWAGRSVAGVGFSGAWVEHVTSEPDGGEERSGTAVRLAYGAGTFGRSAQGISIQEVGADSPVRDAVVDGTPPRAGLIEVRQHNTGSGDGAEKQRSTGVLRRDGLWLQIEGPDEDTVVAVARALEPIPADAR